ncbi:MAG: hypothetical protein ABSF32_10965 [Ignavibacteria bacterium]
MPGKTKYIIITLLLVLVHGCGIFETRNPESPSNTRSTYIPPTTPDAVISNLTYSIEEKNSTNYVRNLSSVLYIYVPDSKALALYGQIFQNWNVNSEKFYFDNLVAQTNKDASSNLFLSNVNTTLISSDSAITQAGYIIVFQHNRNNIPKSAVGNFRLTMKADENNLFSILKWEDFRKNDTDFTWSELKANFSN